MYESIFPMPWDFKARLDGEIVEIMKSPKYDSRYAANFLRV